RCIGNPLAAQRMPTIMRVRSHRLGARTRHFTDISDLTPAEQSDLASIRLRELELMHVADGPFASPRHQFSSLWVAPIAVRKANTGRTERTLSATRGAAKKRWARSNT